jgi:hypothetical protein
MASRPNRARRETDMNHTRRTLSAAIALAGLGFAGMGFAQKKDNDKKDADKPKGKGKAKHKNGKNLLGDKIKVNGNHQLEKQGPHAVSVDVKDGKIAKFHVKHDQKGELPVKKYKTSKKMAQLDQRDRSPIVTVQYMGTTYIGYAYYDEYGDEVIYWYPYDMIYDGDTGAVEYVAAY